MNIRPFEIDDLSQGYLEALSALFPSPDCGVYTQLAACQTVFSQGRLLLPKVCTFVAEEDSGVVVGTASLLVRPCFSHDCRPAGHVEDVAVHPDWQRKGVGRALVSRLIEEAGRLKCYKVVLNCDLDNERFYQKLGFRVTSDAFMRIDL